MEFLAPDRTERLRFAERAKICLLAVALGAFASILIQFVAWVSIVTAGPIGCTGYAMCISDNLQTASAMSAIALITVAAVVRTLISEREAQPDRPLS